MKRAVREWALAEAMDRLEARLDLQDQKVVLLEEAVQRLVLVLSQVAPVVEALVRDKAAQQGLSNPEARAAKRVHRQGVERAKAASAERARLKAERAEARRAKAERRERMSRAERAVATRRARAAEAKRAKPAKAGAPRDKLVRRRSRA